MATNESNLGERIISYLVDMASGDFSITDSDIEAETDQAVQEILVGLVTFYEDIQFSRQEHERMTQALTLAKENAIKATKAKSEFLSTMSHELRTPLTSIQGALGLVTGGAMGVVARVLDWPLLKN